MDIYLYSLFLFIKGLEYGEGAPCPKLKTKRKKGGLNGDTCISTLLCCALSDTGFLFLDSSIFGIVTFPFFLYCNLFVLQF